MSAHFSNFNFSFIDQPVIYNAKSNKSQKCKLSNNLLEYYKIKFQNMLIFAFASDGLSWLWYMSIDNTCIYYNLPFEIIKQLSSVYFFYKPTDYCS